MAAPRTLAGVRQAMRTTITAALMLGASLALPCVQVAQAQDQPFAERIATAVPQGYCSLDPKRPQEAQMLDQQQKLQQPQSALLLMFVDCKDLEQLRAGGGVNQQRYGTLVILPHRSAVNATRSEFVAAVAKQYSPTDLDAIKRQLADQGQPSTGARVLGVLKQDDRAVYLGVAVDSVSVDGKQVPAGIVGVTAVTLLSGAPVSLNLYQVKGGADAVPGLLADQQHYVEALLAANAAPAAAPSPATPSRPGVGSIDLQSPALQVAVIAGLVLFVAIVASLTLRRRKRPSVAPKEPIPPA